MGSNPIPAFKGNIMATVTGPNKSEITAYIRRKCNAVNTKWFDAQQKCFISDYRDLNLVTYTERKIENFAIGLGIENVDVHIPSSSVDPSKQKQYDSCTINIEKNNAVQ